MIDGKLLSLGKQSDDNEIVQNVTQAFRRVPQTFIDGKMVACSIRKRTCEIVIAVKKTIVLHAITDQLALGYIKLIKDKDLRSGLLTKTTQTTQEAVFQVSFLVDPQLEETSYNGQPEIEQIPGDDEEAVAHYFDTQTSHPDQKMLSRLKQLIKRENVVPLRPGQLVNVSHIPADYDIELGGTAICCICIEVKQLRCLVIQGCGHIVCKRCFATSRDTYGYGIGR